MLAIRKYLLAGVASLGMLSAGATASVADPLVLAPNAPNNGQGPITAVPIAPFSTTSAQYNFASDIVIQSPTNGGSSGIGATETGSLIVTDIFNGGSNITPITGLPTDYNLVATFLITAQGGWSGSVFILDPTTVAVTVNLYAAPGGAVATSTPSTSPQNFGISTVGDTLLGTLSYLPNPGNFGIVTDNGNLTGNTSFTASLLPNLNPNYTGPLGFFNNVIGTGLNLNLSTSNSTNSTGSPETVLTHITAGVDGCTNAAGCDRFLTVYGAPNGSITWSVAAVPEPSSLAVVGTALFGLGALRLRRRRRNQ